MKQFIFNFSGKQPKKDFNAKHILGGKGADLAEMGRLGLSVPPGFTISTKVCDLFYKNKKKLSPFIIKSVKKELGSIEKVTKKDLVIRKVHYWFPLDLVQEYQCPE